MGKHKSVTNFYKQMNNLKSAFEPRRHGTFLCRTSFIAQWTAAARGCWRLWSVLQGGTLVVDDSDCITVQQYKPYTQRTSLLCPSTISRCPGLNFSIVCLKWCWPLAQLTWSGHGWRSPKWQSESVFWQKAWAVLAVPLFSAWLEDWESYWKLYTTQTRLCWSYKYVWKNKKE